MWEIIIVSSGITIIVWAVLYFGNSSKTDSIDLGLYDAMNKLDIDNAYRPIIYDNWISKMPMLFEGGLIPTKNKPCRKISCEGCGQFDYTPNNECEWCGREY